MFNGLGALAAGLTQGLKQGDDYNLALQDRKLKQTTVDRQLRQEQMKILSEVLERAEKDPEMMLQTLSDPKYAAELGLGTKGYMSLIESLKQKAEETQHSRELLRLYGSNQLTPEHLTQYSKGIPRTVAANKDFAARIEQQDLDRAYAELSPKIAEIQDPDQRRRALPGIIAGYKGPGGPGQAARVVEKYKVMDTLGGPQTSIEAGAKAREMASMVMSQYRRGMLSADQARQELAYANIPLEQLPMWFPQAMAEIKEIEAAATKKGGVIGEAQGLASPAPGQDNMGIPDVTTSGYFGEATSRPALPGRTVANFMATHAGNIAKEQEVARYTGPLEVFDVKNPGATNPESYGVTENRRDKAKALAGETPNEADALKARAAADRARVAVMELQKDDKNIAAAKRLVEAMSTAAIAHHILKSLPAEQAKELQLWYQRAQQLLRTSPAITGGLPGQGGGLPPRPAPAGGAGGDWVIKEVPTPKR